MAMLGPRRENSINRSSSVMIFYVKVVRMEGDVVKLGIQAPISVPVHRQGSV